ncbi:hypothetical protein [Mucilaginibacter sp. PAMB04168]|uniref:hypothetical protein n=1 Tax=Mucilaginibacter sp. PAMB04168 TaxID=3138567 RepID=UPI0031F68809
MKALLLNLLMACCTLCVQGQSQQAQLKSLLDRNAPCKFEGKTISLVDTNLYATSRNVSYSYAYSFPKYFTEIWPKEEVVSEVRKKTDAYIDTVTYISPDKQATFKIFAGQVVPFPLGRKRALRATDIQVVEKAVDDYIKTIKSGKDKELRRVKIMSLCKGIKGYNYSIQVKGYRGNTQYLYKIIVAELPATGELIFSHFLYRYDTSVKDKYEALGITLANAFGVDE